MNNIWRTGARSKRIGFIELYLYALAVDRRHAATQSSLSGCFTLFTTECHSWQTVEWNALTGARRRDTHGLFDAERSFGGGLYRSRRDEGALGQDDREEKSRPALCAALQMCEISWNGSMWDLAASLTCYLLNPPPQPPPQKKKETGEAATTKNKSLIASHYAPLKFTSVISRCKLTYITAARSSITKPSESVKKTALLGLFWQQEAAKIDEKRRDWKRPDEADGDPRRQQAATHLLVLLSRLSGEADKAQRRRSLTNPNSKSVKLY